MTGRTGVRLLPVGDRGVLVEFSGEADEANLARVRALDRRIAEADISGVVEVVPAYVSALVVFDPVQTDHEEVSSVVRALVDRAPAVERPPRQHRVPVCYDREFGPDLPAVADATGLTPAEVVDAHAASSHRVVMFGFSPGASYLSGVDPMIRLPRKPAPVRDVPAGSVIIAGSQCLVMTVTMSTGWWVVGRTPLTGSPMLPGADSGVDIGDVVEFVPVDRIRFDELRADVTEPDAGSTS